MPARLSAGILLYRLTEEAGGIRVLIAHMGGPYWQGRDAGAWSIPKGEHAPDEDPLACARREFTEELGVPVPSGPVRALGTVTQSGGKMVTAWAVEADLDPAATVSNTFDMEWPRGSGTIRTFPEVDRVTWVEPREGSHSPGRGAGCVPGPSRRVVGRGGCVPPRESRRLRTVGCQGAVVAGARAAPPSP